MNEREKMLAGLPYRAGARELVAQQQATSAASSSTSRR
jgi:hypothetical protein